MGGSGSVFDVSRADSYGVVAFLEPDDHVFYESLIEHPLEMPDHPQVVFYFQNITLPLSIYLESAVAILVRMGDREGLHLLDYCVDRFLPWIGNYFLSGYWKKFLVDQLVLEPMGDGWTAKAIQKDDRLWINLKFVPRDITEIACNGWQMERLQDSEYIRHIPVLIGFRKATAAFRALYGMQLSLNKDFRDSIETYDAGQSREVYILETDFIRPPEFSYRTGTVRICTGSNQTWTRMVPPMVETPGIFVKHSRAKGDKAS